MTDAPELRLEMQANLPPELVNGVHADMASLWYTNGTFVLDFGAVANNPSPATNNDTGEQVMLLPVSIVSRVRYSADQIPALIELLQSQHKAYTENTTRLDINQQLDNLLKMTSEDPETKR